MPGAKGRRATPHPGQISDNFSNFAAENIKIYRNGCKMRYRRTPECR